MVQECRPGDVLRVMKNVGGGGGHHLYVKDFKVTLRHRKRGMVRETQSDEDDDDGDNDEDDDEDVDDDDEDDDDLHVPVVRQRNCVAF